MVRSACLLIADAIVPWRVCYTIAWEVFFMGQYRLWLQYREIDQLLHAQLKTLVKELTQVDEQINLLASNTLQVDNVIIQALLKELQVSLVPVPDVPVQAISSPIRSSLTDE